MTVIRRTDKVVNEDGTEVIYASYEMPLKEFHPDVPARRYFEQLGMVKKLTIERETGITVYERMPDA